MKSCFSVQIIHTRLAFTNCRATLAWCGYCRAG